MPGHSQRGDVPRMAEMGQNMSEAKLLFNLAKLLFEWLFWLNWQQFTVRYLFWDGKATLFKVQCCSQK